MEPLENKKDLICIFIIKPYPIIRNKYFVKIAGRCSITEEAKILPHFFSTDRNNGRYRLLPEFKSIAEKIIEQLTHQPRNSRNNRKFANVNDRLGFFNFMI